MKAIEENSLACAEDENIKLAQTLRKIMAGRSIVECSEESGISISFFSKALNNRLNSKPTKRTVLRLEALAQAHDVTSITLDEIYRAAGYTDADIPKDEPSLRRPKGKNEGKRSLTSQISFVYASKNTENAMNLFLNSLIRSGAERNFDIKLRNEYFEVMQNNSKRGKKLAYVGIDAFYNNRANLNLMTVNVASKIAKSLADAESEKEQRKKIYFIMTDQKRFFDHCVRTLPPLQARGTVILYCEDGKTFSDGIWKLPNGKSCNWKQEEFATVPR